MALVIYDVTKRPASHIVGREVEKVVRFTADTDYAAGGYLVEAAALGLTEITHVDVTPTAGFIPEWTYNDADTGHLKILYGNYDAADGPLIEVPDGHNAIDGLFFRALVRGIA